MEVSGQLHDPAALPQGKNLCYPFDRRLGGPQSRSGSTVHTLFLKRLIQIFFFFQADDRFRARFLILEECP
jgi:hypothetical protein